MSKLSLREKIRAEIKPIPRVPSYPTSWNGNMTFEQIYDDLAHYATNIMKSKGIHRTNHLPDCLQYGFMALWLELVEDNEFLKVKTTRIAGGLLKPYKGILLAAPQGALVQADAPIT